MNTVPNLVRLVSLHTELKEQLDVWQENLVEKVVDEPFLYAGAVLMVVSKVHGTGYQASLNQKLWFCYEGKKYALFGYGLLEMSLDLYRRTDEAVLAKFLAVVLELVKSDKAEADQ